MLLNTIEAANIQPMKCGDEVFPRCREMTLVAAEVVLHRRGQSSYEKEKRKTDVCGHRVSRRNL